MKRLWLPQAISIGMLAWALNPNNPYGYYILLRIVCCACFAYLAIRAGEFSQTGWAWIFSVFAIIYNPIFRVHLTRNIWAGINVITIIFIVISIFTKKEGAEK
jgi:hypothetical protein